MTILQALDIVIERSGHERYRFLCLSHENPRVRSEYSAWVIAEATGTPFVAPIAAEETMPIAESNRLNRLAKACAFRSRQGCGCGGYHCALAGRTVSGQECLDCVRRYGW